MPPPLSPLRRLTNSFPRRFNSNIAVLASLRSVLPTRRILVSNSHRAHIRFRLNCQCPRRRSPRRRHHRYPILHDPIWDASIALAMEGRSSWPPFVELDTEAGAVALARWTAYAPPCSAGVQKIPKRGEGYALRPAVRRLTRGKSTLRLSASKMDHTVPTQKAVHPYRPGAVYHFFKGIH